MTDKKGDAKTSRKKYPGKGKVEVCEIYVAPLDKKDALPVDIDGDEFMIMLVTDKDNVEIERYDFLKMDDVRMDSPGGKIRIYPAMGCKKLVYDYERHSVASVRKEKKPSVN